MAYLRGIRERVIKMRHDDGSDFFDDDSEEAVQILEAMQEIANALCDDINNSSMRHLSERAKLITKGCAFADQYIYKGKAEKTSLDMRINLGDRKWMWLEVKWGSRKLDQPPATHDIRTQLTAGGTVYQAMELCVNADQFSLCSRQL